MKEFLVENKICKMTLHSVFKNLSAAKAEAVFLDQKKLRDFLVYLDGLSL